ncbi:MAG: PEP-CTERM sorting domain-containing protein [Pirellulales bacterium]|nr:PEP-CTERM sorting domain-containing protein [Planctomycetales bacterium]
MKKLVAFVAVVALAAPAFALPTLDYSRTDNGDGTVTDLVTITTLNEVSFLDMTISAHDPGALIQQDGGATYTAVSGSPWKPSVIFASDSTLATALNPAGYHANLDTFVADEFWPGKVTVVLDPVAGSGGSVAGTSSVRVALTSFTGGVGGPLPGGVINLVQVTHSGEAWVMGALQSDSDKNGSFSLLLPGTGVPEPSTMVLAGIGLIGMISGLRRRRS